MPEQRKLPKISWLERASYRSYAVAQALVFAPLILLLALDGFSTMDIAVILIVFVISLIFWWLRRTHVTPEMREIDSVQRALENGQKYTLVQLYGTYCAGCVAVNPLVDQLEKEGADKLQVLRLNIEHPPGQYLKPDKLSFTPQFLLYDPTGNLIRQTYLVLDRAKILYECEHPSERTAGSLP